MRFIDLFCGIGGFRLGLERANDSTQERIQQGIGQRGKSNTATKQSLMGTEQFTCVWSCDIDKWARQIYKKNFGEEPEGDITKIPAESIPDHDLLCAGFPCQSFSIAGKRKGFADTRGTLFFDICRILQAKRPSYCLLENVKGLLSHDNGETFKTILESLDELGYGVQWQVLNSKHFGVPQNRERVFIVGSFRGRRRSEVFPITESIGIHIENPREKQRQKIGSTIRPGISGIPGSGETYVIGYTRKFDKKKKVIREDHFKNEFSQVKQRAGNQDQFIFENKKIRRLTPIECERLQGFPDNWTQGVSDTQRYKLLGNAVTVNVIEFLGKRLAQEVMGL